MHSTRQSEVSQGDMAIPPVEISLQHKVLIGTLLLVLAPTVLCAFWLGSIARDALSRRQAQAAEMLGQSTAASLSGLTGEMWGEAGDDVIDGLMLDPRVSFVLVSGASGQTLHQRTHDPRDWAAFEELSDAAARNRAELGEPVGLDDGGQLFVFRAPIWDRALAHEQLALASPPKQTLQGHVVIGMRDPELAGVVTRLRDAQLAVTVAVCLLVLPLVWLAVRQWLRPLRTLTGTALDLAHDHFREPVAVRSNDEVGQLAGAFNRMAVHLWTARQELEQSNAVLEQKVEE
ncbi:MAG: HAMP domain-containing protein, partial [Rhodospirillales bacterium]|nr:HAMP domain-containing protein [Rhodospirillales bacterium]